MQTVELDNRGVDLSNLPAPGADDSFLDEASTSSGERAPELRPVEHDDDDKSLIMKITKYKEKFPDACALVDLNALQFMSTEQLEAYLDKVRLAVCNRNATSMVAGMIDSAIVIAEKFGAAYDPRLQGLHSDLVRDPDYQKTLEEISIEYSSFSYTRPELRLAMMLARATAARMMSPPVQTNVNPEVKARFDNL